MEAVPSRRQSSAARCCPPSGGSLSSPESVRSSRPDLLDAHSLSDPRISSPPSGGARACSRVTLSWR